MRGLIQCRHDFEFRLRLLSAAVLIAGVPFAVGQQPDQQKAPAVGSGALKYQISASLSEHCTVETSLNLHQVVFDFHNDSCHNSKHVVDRKIPTLPKGPRYSNVRITGYHFIDWAEGHSSPSTRNSAKVELSKTDTTLSVSGWLGKASCSKGPSADVLAEDTVWQARIVPEVKLLEDVERQEPAVTMEIVPPSTGAVLTLAASCAGDREDSLQFSVTPVVDGIPQSPIYISPVFAAGKTASNSDGTLGSASIHSHWSQQSSGGKSELTLTIFGANGQAPGGAAAPSR